MLAFFFWCMCMEVYECVGESGCGCVYTHVHIYIWVCTHACTCTGGHCSSLSTIYFEHCLFLHWLGSLWLLANFNLDNCLQGYTCLCPVLKLQMHPSIQGLYVCAGDPNSGLHVCREGTSMTQPSPWPNVWPLYIILPFSPFLFPMHLPPHFFFFFGEVFWDIV